MAAPLLFAALGLGALALLGGRRRRSPAPAEPGDDHDHAGEGELDMGAADRDWSHLHPAFADALSEVFQDLRSLGWDPKLAEGFRSAERQAALKAAGKSTVTWGYHMYTLPDGTPAALAADVYDGTDGWGNMKFFDALAAIATARGMESGHYWRSFKDSAHVQAAPSSILSKIRDRRVSPDAYLAELDATPATPEQVETTCASCARGKGGVSRV